jgi:two-component system, cell cycle sensor histidine kinase and response regulator CckA
VELSQQIEAVYRRVLLLRQYAMDLPVLPDLLEKALQELYFVLEELQTSQEELRRQNQALIATQQAVELERQRYQTLFELAPNGYLLTDLKGNIHQANHHAAALLFHTPQEYLINKPLLVFVHEPDRPQFQVQLANLPPQQPWEVMLSSRHGTLISVAISVTQIKGLQQQKDMLLWSLHDITLRKRMEHQLQVAHDQLETRIVERTADLAEANRQLKQEMDERQQAEQKIRDQAALIDIATDAIFVQDLDQHITFWSKGAERIYGWAATDILGQSASLLFLQDAALRLTTGFTQTLEQGSWQAELEQVTHTGNPIVVESRWTLVQSETGQPQSILVVSADITAKKQLEAQFYRAQRIESLGMLASGIAHDLNNVLTPIAGFAQLKLRHQPDLTEQDHEIWQTIGRTSQQGVDLVRQIMLFARGSSGKRIPLQVRDLLLDIGQTIRRTFPKSIAIYTHIPTDLLWLIAADPTQLQQVVLNLCVNARDAMPNGGTLTLAIANQQVNATQAQKYLDTHAGRYVVLTVSDTGLGIPPALIEQIFEPFFTTKATGKGTGLGLSTVFNIVKNHGGFIELSSEEGKGTQFQVYLPAIAESAAESAIA